MPKEWVQLKMEERILAKWPNPLSKETKCQTKEIFNNLLRSAEISKKKKVQLPDTVVMSRKKYVTSNMWKFRTARDSRNDKDHLAL